MWKQLTQKARKAIFLAQEEAGRLGYNHVGTEHLLLAIIREDDCIAATMLERLGLDLGTIRSVIMEKLSKGSDMLGEDMQLTAEAKQAIQLAFEEGKQMREEWIGTEHLLIGLARESSSVASKVLADLGAETAGLRIQMRNLHATLPFDEIEGISRNKMSIPTA